jgi:uncharacterized membrane protein HdeD (DUF308 family)
MVEAAAELHDPAAQAMFGDHLPRHNWAWFLVRGVIALLLGLIALFAPGVTVFAFALVFAAFSFADGVTQLIAGIRGATHKSQLYGSLIFGGIIGIAIGVLFVISPIVSTAVYTLMLVILIAFWALVTGALEVAAAARLRRAISGERLLGLSGVLSILLGLALLALVLAEPGLTMLSIGWLIAFYAFASGIVLIVLAFRLRRQAGA